jgi:hypothetical protein
MSWQKYWDYWKVRLDFVKILYIHLTTWITFIVLVMLVKPSYELVAPRLAQAYFDIVVKPFQKDIVIPKTIKANPYSIGESRVIDLNNGQKILYLLVSNKDNPDIGFYPWSYTYQVLSASGEVLEQRSVFDDFLLPDEQTYIVVYTSNPQAVSLRIQLDEVNTNLVPYNRESPNFLKKPNIVQRRGIVNDDPKKDFYEVSLLFKNDDTVDVKTVNVLYLLRSNDGQIVGMNKSVLSGFLANTEREITVLDLPKPSRALTNKPLLEVVLRINYLDPTIVTLS